MEPKDKELARRIIACGLTKPNHWIKGTVATIQTTAQLQVDCGHLWRNPYTNGEGGILWTFVTTETGPELLPVLEDFALLGWLVAEIERVSQKQVGVYQSSDCPTWWACMDFADAEQCFEGASRIEALTAALEAAKGAA